MAEQVDRLTGLVAPLAAENVDLNAAPVDKVIQGVAQVALHDDATAAPPIEDDEGAQLLILELARQREVRRRM
jgi:hypothetical protein